MGKSIKSKKRVQEHGEVFTDEREVKAMCDICDVEGHLSNKNNRILEPTCGNGNFLVEILNRRLMMVSTPADALYTIRGIYGVDIMQDNIDESKSRLFTIAHDAFPDIDKEELLSILDKNIICGDLLNIDGVIFDLYDGNEPEVLKGKYLGKAFKMMIGNPPYQKMDGGGTGASAMAFFQVFIELGISAKIDIVSMIVPAKWLFTDGKGLTKFRNERFTDHHFTHMSIYPESRECFPLNSISGGICFFRRDNDYDGKCEIHTIRGGEIVSTRNDYIFDDNGNHLGSNIEEDIIKKVEAYLDTITTVDMLGFNIPPDFMYNPKKKPDESLISPRQPFGLNSKHIPSNQPGDDVKFYYFSGGAKTGMMHTRNIKRNKEWISKPKILIAKTGEGALGEIPSFVTATPFAVSMQFEKVACSETYLVVGPFDTPEEVDSMLIYMKSKMFRFMVSTEKSTHNAARGVYSAVPVLPLDKTLNDEYLFELFKLNEEEIAYINEVVKPMS